MRDNKSAYKPIPLEHIFLKNQFFWNPDTIHDLKRDLLKTSIEGLDRNESKPTGRKLQKGRESPLLTCILL